MQVFTELTSLPALPPMAIAVGTFDGVHCGHQGLVRVLRETATQRSLASGVLTFTDMPYCLFHPETCPRLLTLAEEKIAAFARLNLDYLFIVPFTRELARQSYDEFTCGVLRRQLALQLLVAGPDFALGKNRTGNLAALRELGRRENFDVHFLSEKLLCDGVTISSTRARGAVESGDMAAATCMLGRDFSLLGKVVPGKKLGRDLGVPTINLQMQPRQVLPASGIYAARVVWPGLSTPLPAALSIGTNPTVDDTPHTKIEFHAIGHTIVEAPATARLEVVARLREQQKFASLDALATQMRQDITHAAQLLATAVRRERCAEAGNEQP